MAMKMWKGESNYKCMGKMKEFLQRKLDGGWIKECSHGEKKSITREFWSEEASVENWGMAIIDQGILLWGLIPQFLSSFYTLCIIIAFVYKWRICTSEKLRNFPNLKHLILGLGENSESFWPQSSYFITSPFVMDISRRKGRNTNLGSYLEGLEDQAMSLVYICSQLGALESFAEERYHPNYASIRQLILHVVGQVIREEEFGNWETTSEASVWSKWWVLVAYIMYLYP